MNKPAHNNDTRITGTRVAASPFNAVKLELILIIIIGITLGLVVNHSIEQDAIQFIVLAAYGLLASAWIVLRVRSLARTHQQSSELASKPQTHD